MLHKDLVEVFINNGFVFKHSIKCEDELLIDEIEYWEKDNIVYLIEVLVDNVINIFQQIDLKQVAN